MRLFKLIYICIYFLASLDIASAQTINGNCNSVGNNNSNCNTYTGSPKSPLGGVDKVPDPQAD